MGPAAAYATIIFLAWAQLPEFAAPKGGVVEPGTVDLSDVITYRTLTRADFKGTNPPPWFAAVADRVGAATCAYVLTTPDTNMKVDAVRSPGGETVYRAVPQNLAFIARMDRNCSWWNDAQERVPAEYVLEHEQIHFALFEIEARRMNAESEEIKAKLHAEAPSIEAAAAIAQRKLEEQIALRLDVVLARNRAFDEDTSMGHEPEKQKRWWDRVQSELAASSD